MWLMAIHLGTKNVSYIMLHLMIISMTAIKFSHCASQTSLNACDLYCTNCRPI